MNFLRDFSLFLACVSVTVMAGMFSYVIYNDNNKTEQGYVCPKGKK